MLASFILMQPSVNLLAVSWILNQIMASLFMKNFIYSVRGGSVKVIMVIKSENKRIAGGRVI